MSARQSARLKGAVTKAVVAAVTTTTTAIARGAKRSVSTTTTTKKTKTVETAAVGFDTTAATKEQQSDSNDSPPAKKAKAAPNENKSSIAGSSAAKDAWGALFAKKSSASKSIGSGGVQLKPTQAISSELQAKIDGYAAFNGLTPRAEASKLKIAAWNVNGLRALLKKEETVHMRAYLAQEDPDVLCLSETKIDKDELQKVLHCVFVSNRL